MRFPMEFVVADEDFYAAPDDSRDDGDDALRPASVPTGWTGTRSGVWRSWRRTEHDALPDDGWKVHVSARAGRIQHVLDIAAALCFAHGVAFKHLATSAAYRWQHAKHANRAQSGKFIAAYPADVAAARRLMTALHAALAGEDGPYILSDRPFRDSDVVFYRYGAFAGQARHQADGTLGLLTRDGYGNFVSDQRGPSFHLPPGIADPFLAEPLVPPPAADLNGFRIESAIRFTNAGGIYLGRESASGRRVVCKEARPHVGTGADSTTAIEQLRAERDILTELHRLAPGLAPEPIAYFTQWKHEFLVMEHIRGQALGPLLARRMPLLRAGSTTAEFAAFYERCTTILSQVEQAIRRLHALGYLFVDLSPSNVMVGDDDTARLVDFGSARPIGAAFIADVTPGFVPPDDLVRADPREYDLFALSRLAQQCLGGLQLIVDRNPDALTHLHHDLSDLAPVPPVLWRQATSHHVPRNDPRLPTPEQVTADPIGHLTALRDGVADALLAMADLTDTRRVFPTIAQGYQSNTLCLAYGTAGVIHALRRAGRALPDGLVERLRRDTLDRADTLGPGLFTGLAGLAQVLAASGHVAEARDLLAKADRHPLTAGCATFFAGAAGVAQAHLALYQHTGDEHHVDRARALAAALPPDATLTGHLGADDATGLMHGRSGVALMLQQLAGVTGDDRYLGWAVRLLHAELDRATDAGPSGLLFPVSRKDRRIMPYLYAGSAGTVLVVTRTLRGVADERLAAALPRLLAPVRLTYTAQPGLMQGLAGFAFTLADHAMLTGDDSARAGALRAARALFKYAIPHESGVRVLGDQLLRFSAELWSGSAGVLLALAHTLDPRPDALFTVDTPIRAAAAGR
ncbi:class III lanthionine synthetase LanKC [Actinoplanes sp. KI2]|uniref:class III lanthionine synthetase LanKC n=1 Tax=Actinoplanes sp. KI2 TaxID=2983315 RepID=UPI0021D5D7A3|nr:class III lanthionine synthetase LanKC [Actinoplanes sp. KI2]MCU7730690.1 class III lanthionine synthetase LanKC [Actinoplanes sp. KI2]